jgi:hypothetical protein
MLFEFINKLLGRHTLHSWTPLKEIDRNDDFEPVITYERHCTKCPKRHILMKDSGINIW